MNIYHWILIGAVYLIGFVIINYFGIKDNIDNYKQGHVISYDAFCHSLIWPFTLTMFVVLIILMSPMLIGELVYKKFIKYLAEKKIAS